MYQATYTGYADVRELSEADFASLGVESPALQFNRGQTQEITPEVAQALGRVGDFLLEEVQSEEKVDENDSRDAGDDESTGSSEEVPEEKAKGRKPSA